VVATNNQQIKTMNQKYLFNIALLGSTLLLMTAISASAGCKDKCHAGEPACVSGGVACMPYIGSLNFITTVTKVTDNTTWVYSMNRDYCGTTKSGNKKCTDIQLGEPDCGM
jgi:hypothetical protein